MDMRAGWRLRVLYVKGMIMIMAAGGADSDRRARRLIKEASSVAGMWLDTAVSRNSKRTARQNRR
jgi:hypothetical protein